MISAAINLHRREDPAFAIIGNIPRGLQDAGVPKITRHLIKTFAAKIPACVIVLLLEHIAIAKSFGRANNYTIDPSQELIAIGVTNLLGPFIGGYSATGAFSRSAIQSKSGVRTPLAGLFTAIVVLIAIYALSAVLFYVPHASLSGVIIHAVGDLLVSPNVIYQFWRIAPLDAVIFTVGLVVAITNSLPNSIYATVGISAAVLLVRLAKAPGNFLGWTWVGGEDTQRPVYLPRDDSDGTESNNKLKMPRPGVYIYRFSEGLSYPNSSHYLDFLVHKIFQSTRRIKAQPYETKGERPWNDCDLGTKTHQAIVEDLPLLRAIILDFSAVNHVDVTSIQNLVDVRTQLNLRAAPLEVQWHFTNIRNRWTKRALAAAGFGYPSLGLSSSVLDGKPVECSNPRGEVAPRDMETGKERPRNGSDQWAELIEERLPSNAPCSVKSKSVIRPYFHSDLTSALQSVDAYIAANPIS